MSEDVRTIRSARSMNTANDRAANAASKRRTPNDVLETEAKVERCAQSFNSTRSSLTAIALTFIVFTLSAERSPRAHLHCCSFSRPVRGYRRPRSIRLLASALAATQFPSRHSTKQNRSLPPSIKIRELLRPPKSERYLFKIRDAEFSLHDAGHNPSDHPKPVTSIVPLGKEKSPTGG
jgi:hypothetical protein